MEIKVIEKDKKKLVFELEGDSHTIPNLLKKELWNDEDVKVSGYTIDHPLVGKPRVVVQSSKKDPKDAVSDASKRIKKNLSDFKKKFEKA